MATRQVRIKTTQTNSWLGHTTDAVTFKDLKDELPNIDFHGKKVVVRENRTTLQLDGAVLPTGDFTVYIMPEKTKSGALTREYIDSAGFHYLRRLSRMYGFPATGVNTETMRRNLYTVAAQETSNSSSKQNIINDLEAIIEKIQALDAGSNEEYMRIIEEDLKDIQRELGV